MLGTPVYLTLQIWLGIASRGGWRLAALAPLLLAVPIALYCIYALALDSNLWPLPFIFFAPLGAVYLVGILALHAVARRAA